MKNISKLSVLALIAMLSGCATNSNIEQILYSNGDIVPSTTQTIFFDKEDGITFNILDSELEDKLSNYTKTCLTDINDVNNPQDLYYPNELNISWTYEGNPTYFVFSIDDEITFNDSIDYLTFDNDITLTNLFIGYTYYYRVDAYYDDHIIRSTMNSFITTESVRAIKIDGVSNTRDIGGHITIDGKKRMKQGLVYRGGNADSITEKGKEICLHELGIKTDLDLREYNTTSAKNGLSPLGENVTLLGYGEDSRGCPYYIGDTTGINSTDTVYRTALLNYLKAFTVKDNYPIYFHCAIGRDRTGTIAFLLEALCNMKQATMYMDYEFSFLSSIANADNSSVETRQAIVNNNFTALYAYIQNYSSGSMSENTEAFMLDLGLTKTEIDSIKDILLEDVK